MQTYLEINLENLKNNVQNLKSLLKKETKFLAVVKSNAYGHGLIETSRALVQFGADWFGVINIDEAIDLREAGIFKPILILGAISAKDARLAANQDISVPIISLSMAREISDINFDKPLKIHLKIDTGLNRLGLEIGEIAEAVRLLKSNRNIEFEGIYSHLASVEENDLAFTKLQIENFKKAVKILEENQIKNSIKHLGATAAAILQPETHFDMVRCGIGLYGLWPSVENKKTYCLKHGENFSLRSKNNFLMPVLSYKTEIIQIKKVGQGEKIGYGCTYEAKKDMTVGILPIGYYEGVDRGLSNCGQVIISGIRCPIVGRVAMNMTIVEISNVNVQLSNKVATIIGQDGDEEIAADEIAEKLGTINYEIVTRLPAHIERRYI